jgi:hypothetical protein
MIRDRNTCAVIGYVGNLFPTQETIHPDAAGRLARGVKLFDPDRPVFCIGTLRSATGPGGGTPEEPLNDVSPGAGDALKPNQFRAIVYKEAILGKKGSETHV